MPLGCTTCSLTIIWWTITSLLLVKHYSTSGVYNLLNLPFLSNSPKEADTGSFFFVQPTWTPSQCFYVSTKLEMFKTPMYMLCSRLKISKTYEHEKDYILIWLLIIVLVFCGFIWDYITLLSDFRFKSLNIQVLPGILDPLTV